MIEVIRMSEEHVAEVSRIESETFSMPWSAESFLEMITCEYALYLVAKDQDKILGCCGIRNLCGDGEITNVVVRKECRHQGIGYMMLTELMKQSRQMGVRSYTLEVRQSNMAAIRLYERLGFITEGIRKNFYEKPTEDALIMWIRQQES